MNLVKSVVFSDLFGGFARIHTLGLRGRNAHGRESSLESWRSEVEAFDINGVFLAIMSDAIEDPEEKKLKLLQSCFKATTTCCCYSFSVDVYLGTQALARKGHRPLVALWQLLWCWAASCGVSELSACLSGPTLWLSFASLSGLEHLCRSRRRGLDGTLISLVLQGEADLRLLFLPRDREASEPWQVDEGSGCRLMARVKAWAILPGGAKIPSLHLSPIKRIRSLADNPLVSVSTREDLLAGLQP